MGAYSSKAGGGGGVSSIHDSRISPDKISSAELQGTEKQIAWAKDIRQKFVNEYNDVYDLINAGNAGEKIDETAIGRMIDIADHLYLSMDDLGLGGLVPESARADYNDDLSATKSKQPIFSKMTYLSGQTRWLTSTSDAERESMRSRALRSGAKGTPEYKAAYSAQKQKLIRERCNTALSVIKSSLQGALTDQSKSDWWITRRLGSRDYYLNL